MRKEAEEAVPLYVKEAIKRSQAEEQAHLRHQIEPRIEQEQEPTLQLSNDAAGYRGGGAEAEQGPTLQLSNNAAGYRGVRVDRSRTKPFQAFVRRAGKEVSLGRFAKAEEAALAYHNAMRLKRRASQMAEAGAAMDD